MSILIFYSVVALLIFAIAMLSIFRNAVPQVSSRKKFHTILISLGISVLWGVCLVGFFFWLLFFQTKNVKES